MNRVSTYCRSVIGMKVLVALTGLLMLGFLVGHVSGNLKAFLPVSESGAEDIDVYAEFLRSLGEPLLPDGGALLVARSMLLIALLLHVVCVVQLSRRNHAARPIGYARASRVHITLASRWMMLTGILVLVFVVFHVLHFTTGTIDPSNHREGAVYANLHLAFRQWPLMMLYVGAVAVVGVHLYHGAWSLFQTLGLDHPDRNKALRRFALVVAVGLFVGFAAVPAAIWGGFLTPPAAHGQVVPRTAMEGS